MAGCRVPDERASQLAYLLGSPAWLQFHACLVAWLQVPSAWACQNIWPDDATPGQFRYQHRRRHRLRPQQPR